MSKSKNTEHFTSIFTFDNLPIRLAIYLSVIGAIILPYYVKNNGIFHENTPTEKRMSMERKTIINALNRGQQAHYLERNKFGKSMDEIGLGITKDTGESSYRIVQPMMPVQDLTQSAISDEHESMIMAIGQKNIKKIIVLVPQILISKITSVLSTAYLKSRPLGRPKSSLLLFFVKSQRKTLYPQQCPS